MSQPWFQTYTGKQYFYLDPKPEMICIEDIARSLSRQARFLGHTLGNEAYSVGQHSILASMWITSVTKWNPEEKRRLEMAALMHDASEAFLGDVPAPLKKIVKGNYMALEELAMRAICLRFDLSYADFADDRVHHIDMTMCATEKRDLTAPEVAPWIDMPPPLGMRIVPEPAHIVEENFIERFRRLGGVA